MPKQAQKPAALRESWRPDSASSEKTANRKRNFQRFLVTALLALFVTAFGFLLFSPLFHPSLRLYFLTAGSYDVMDLKPIPFFQEDAVRFLSIDGSFRKADASNEFSFMQSPEVVRSYFERIVNSESHNSDVTLIQISAHPMLLEKRPFLKCSNFNREIPERGSISMEELLNLLDRKTLGMTVICLALGPSSAQYTADSVRDDFLYSVRDLLKSRNNPNLWILVSNNSQEGSYASMELHASVFSYAITKGLQGAADLNHDDTIDLDEFTRFVVGFTQSQVQLESGGNTQQTPVLISTGANFGTPLNSRPIASAPKSTVPFSWSSFVPNFWGSDASKEESTEKPTEKEAEKAQTEKNWLTEYWNRSSTRIRERTEDELEDNMKFLPYTLGSRIKKAIGIGVDDPEEPIPNKPKTELATAEAKAGTNAGDESARTGKNEQPTEYETIARVPLMMPDLSRLGDPNQSNAQLLQLAWQFCEFLERPQMGIMRPVDLAPHAWNEFISHLHGIEERIRNDSVMDPKILRLQLTTEIIGNYQFAMNGQARVGTLAKRVSAQMPDLSIPKLAIPSIGLLESLSQFGGPPVPTSLAIQAHQLETAIKNDSPELFDQWIAQLPAELSAQYVEFFWPHQFASRPSTPWKITRRLTGLWRQYEQISYDPLSSNSSVEQEFLLTQQLLLDGTRQALDQIGADWTDRCLQTLDRAEQALTTSSNKRNQLRDAMQSRNQRMAEAKRSKRNRNVK